MKQKITILVALLAGFCAYFVSKSNYETFKTQFQKQFETVLVVAAARDIPPGTVLRLDDIGTKTVFAKSVTGRAVRPDEYTELIGKRTRTFLQRQQPLLWSDIDMPYGGLGGLSSMIASGERAISIAVDMTSSVTGHIKPNDHVDLLGTFTFPGAARNAGAGPQSGADTVTLTILQDVTILATGKNTGRRNLEYEGVDRMGADNYATVTVSVTPQEAEMLVFASQKGRLSLALRNRADVSVVQITDSVDFSKLEKNFTELNNKRQQRLHPNIVPFTVPPAQPRLAPPSTAIPAPTPVPAPRQ